MFPATKIGEEPIFAGTAIVFFDNSDPVRSQRPPLMSYGLSVRSVANGLGSLNLIVADGEFRQKISITDEQLLDIKKILREKKLIVGDNEKNDSEAKIYIAKTLTNAQIRQLRIEVVKDRFSTPVNLFEAIFLNEIGVDNQDAGKVFFQCYTQKLGIIQKNDKLRVEAIKNALPPDSQEAVWKLFGRELSIDDKGLEWDKISKLQEVSIDRQLSSAVYMHLPIGLGLTKEQHKQLGKLDEEFSLKRTKNVSFTNDEMSLKLDSILSRPQRFAIVQSMQREIIRNDLLVVFRPEVVKYLNLSEEGISEARVELTEAQKRIAENQELEILQACKEVLKTLPLPIQREIIDLADGVWTLN